MFCTKCGKELSNDARFCGFCGNPLTPQRLICPACGRELGEQMIYCSYCGTKADTAEADSAYRQSVRAQTAAATGQTTSTAAATGLTAQAFGQTASPTAVTGPAAQAYGQTASPAASTGQTTQAYGQTASPAASTGPVAQNFGQTPQNTAAAGQTTQAYGQTTSAASTGQTTQAYGQTASPAAAPAWQDTAKLKTVRLSWYPGDVKFGVAKATGNLHIYRNRIEFEKTIGSSGSAALGLIGMAVSASKARKEAPMIYEMSQIRSVQESRYGGTFPAMLIELKSGEKHTFAGSFNARDIQECISLIRSNIR